MSRNPNPVGLASRLSEFRNDYAAARESRFKKRRTGINLMGSGADYHFRAEADYLKTIEYARDMDRNDAIVGQMVDRAVLNTVQNGFTCDPQTGDAAVDKRLYELFEEWANDPQACDSQGEMTFADMQEHVLRSRFVDGDCFALPRDDGTLQIVEAHRCRSQFVNRAGWVGKVFGVTKLAPLNSAVVLGVELDDDRRRLNYWFTSDDIDLNSTTPPTATPYPAFDADGEPQVFHVYDPKRITQTRGVTAFAPVFEMLGLFDDLNFAKIVQQQIVSCIAFIREKPIDFKGGSAGQLGPRETEEMSDGVERLIEDIAPGIILEGRPGEKISGFSPNVPNSEFFPHVRLILQLVGVNLGMPLVMLLMDASETNFSGWRGAVDQARMGFLRNQRWLKDRFNHRVYRWKVRQFIDEDEEIGAAFEKLGEKLFAVRWNAPRWPYIQPLQDAQADELRLKARLTSPRRMHNDRGQDVDEIVAETVADNAVAIRLALTEAKAISTEFGVPIEASRLLYIDATQPLAILGAPAPAPDADPGDETKPEPEAASAEA